MQLVDYSLHYNKYSHAGMESVQSKVISETAASLTVNGEIWLSFMCTSADLKSLAVGVLY
jgi:formate dehydrogenase assembly factor FdhD